MALIVATSIHSRKSRAGSRGFACRSLRLASSSRSCTSGACFSSRRSRCRDHRVHPGAVRGAADAHPFPAQPGQLRGLHRRPAVLYVIGMGAYSQLSAIYEDLPKYGERIGDIVDNIRQKVQGMEERDLPVGRARPPAAKQQQEQERLHAAAAGRAGPQAQRTPSRRRPRRARRPGPHPRSPHPRREHADRRLHLVTPERGLPGPADGLVRAVPGVLHAELARPHQPQLPAVLPRRGPR